jgi:membrane protein DedA with SNARE-associated domain
VTLPNKSVTVICLLLFGGVLLAGSIGAFFLYIPFISIASVVVILLGMALAFMIGERVGGTRVLRLRLIEQRARRFRLGQNSPGNDVKAPLALAAPLDE